MQAARNEDISICRQTKYVHQSGDMSATMKEIIENRCCSVTVLFGQSDDLAALFVEAYKQNYAGEWVVPDLPTRYNGLRKHIKDLLQPNMDINKVLRGMHGAI